MKESLRFYPCDDSGRLKTNGNKLGSYVGFSFRNKVTLAHPAAFPLAYPAILCPCSSEKDPPR